MCCPLLGRPKFVHEVEDLLVIETLGEGLGTLSKDVKIEQLALEGL